MGTFTLPKRAVLLLCSDGLYDLVDDQEIVDTVRSTRPLDQACLKLVKLANERSGHDNITVVLARIVARR